MKKLNLLFLLLISISYLTVCADDKNNNELSKFLDVSSDNAYYNELRKYYDKIELKYICGENYINGYDMEYFFLQRLTYYGYKKNEKYMLGYVTLEGLYDKDSNLIREAVAPENRIILGLSSETFDTPWSPSYAVEKTLRKKSSIGNVWLLGHVRVDFDNDSLKTVVVEY